MVYHENKIKEMIKEVSQELKKEIENKRIVLVAHHDVDGLISSFIFSQAIRDLAKDITFFFTDNLFEDTLQKINTLEGEVVIFFDIGALNEDNIKKKIRKKKWYIIDHHATKQRDSKKIINPYSMGIDGSKNVCSSTLSYLIASQIGDVKDYTALSLVGSVGDSQLVEGKFKGVNKEIMKMAESTGRVEIKKDIALFGTTIRPLYKSLSYLLDNEEIGDIKAIEILKTTLSPEKQRRIKEIKLQDLSDEEIKRLKDILLYLYTPTFSSSLIENKYILKKNKKIKKEYEIRELSTLLNALCRLREYKVALSFLEEGMKNDKEVYDYYDKYREIISRSMHKAKSNYLRKNKLIILTSTLKIPSSIIGVICNLLANKYFKKEIIIGLSKDEEKIKFSLRVGKDMRGKIDVGKVVRELSNNHNYIKGNGHKDAAGGFIFGNSKEKENEFLEDVSILISRYLNI